MSPAPELVVLGNLLLDDIVFDDGSTRMGQPGGAALYSALGARIWGIEVGVASVVGEDYPPTLLDQLAGKGIDVSGVRRLDRSGLRTWLLYEGRLRRVVHRLGGPTHAEVSPTADDLPRSWLDSPAFHVAPVPFEIQQGLVADLGRRSATILSLDPYELLTDGGLEAWRALLSQVDLFSFSEDEMQLEGGRENPAPALQSLVSGGRPRRILFKQGADGGLAYDAITGRLRRWPARSVGMVDPTGAGDAFTGGVLAGLLRGLGLGTSLAMGTVSASFAIAGLGADALLEADAAAARRRLADRASE